MQTTPKQALPEKHVWVNDWEHCNECNYGTHRCYFCGTDLDHEEYDGEGNHHTVEFCRPDLFEHEPGIGCTWPWRGECYWDHQNHRLFDKGWGPNGIAPMSIAEVVQAREELNA